MRKRRVLWTLSPDHLSPACGGMRIDHFRRSTNIEDYRDMSLEESERLPEQRLPPLLRYPRWPGDLPSQLGLDHLDEMTRRRRF